MINWQFIQCATFLCPDTAGIGSSNSSDPLVQKNLILKSIRQFHTTRFAEGRSQRGREDKKTQTMQTIFNGSLSWDYPSVRDFWKVVQSTAMDLGNISTLR